MTEAIALPLRADAARASLVRRAQEGDHAAFDLLIRPALDRQLRFALSLLGNEMDARDVVQETCLRAWRELPRLREPGRFDSWISQILVNQARSSMRRRVRAKVRQVPVDSLDTESPAAGSPPSVADRLSERDLLRRAFARLDPDKRLLLALHHVEDRSIAEIAADLGIPEGTAKWRLHAARAALERALEVERR